MKLLIGLGNPGKSYDKTRHNAGFMVIDRLAERHGPAAPVKARFNAACTEVRMPGAGAKGGGAGGAAGEPVLLLKPTTYMNRSGAPVAEAINFYKLDPARDLLVIVDDVALPCGAIRLRPGGGPGGHNGLADIQRALGHDAYPRLRVGIDPSPEFMDQADYVLGRFTDPQWALVKPALDKAADACEVFVRDGLDAAMNRFNAPPSESAPHPRKPRPGANAGPAPSAPLDPTTFSQVGGPPAPPSAPARPSSPGPER
jgi:PTH1 family peptidyl-tRNA hydrolase